MFSPAKAITVGALVFALGGAFLIAQPFDQQGSVPGAATDAEAATPVAVTATNSAGSCSAGTVETLGGVTASRGGTCQPAWTWSDERLNGTVTWAENVDRYTDGSGLSVRTFALSVENDEGGWRMRPLPQVEFPGAPAVAAEVWVMDGEGAYEGLTAVVLVEGYEPHGFIIDGSTPPPPENASTK
jgi:hypothetical protein